MSEIPTFGKYCVEEYSFNDDNIGHAYIFSNYQFGNDKPDMNENKADVNALKALLEKMGLKCQVYENCKRGEFFTGTLGAKALNLSIGVLPDFLTLAAQRVTMDHYHLRIYVRLMSTDKYKIELEKITGEHYDDDSCMMMFFLSHGSLETVAMQNFDVFKSDIFDSFEEQKCEYLRRKPKLFFFQTCFGSRTDIEVIPLPENTNESKAFSFIEGDETECANKEKLPKRSDMLFCYASSPGFVALQHPEEGSRFIQTFCKVLTGYMESRLRLDFISLMTVVGKKMAEITEYPSISYEDPNKTAKKAKIINRRQMPCFTSTLRKQLYFPTMLERGLLSPKGDDDSDNADFN